MRIAFLTHQWPGARMGGIGSCIRQTAIALDGAGHEVHVFTLSLPDDVRDDLPENVRVHETPDVAECVRSGQIPMPSGAAINQGGEGVYRLAIAWRLCDSFLQAHKHVAFDIVEAPEVEALGLPLMLAADLEIPVVTHLYCSTALARRANGDLPKVDSPLIDALETAAVYLADSVCSPSQFMLDQARSLIGFPQDGEVIPQVFVCSDEAASAPPSSGPILFVGRLERLKGVEAIVEALNDFLPRHPDVQFRFAGPDTKTGPGGGSMQQWMESQLSPRCRSQVEFLGQLPPTRIAEEWKQARFGVLPSLFENFPMACCEAMAAGRTVIAGAGTGMVELIGDAGVVADHRSLGDAMERLWSDSALLAKLSDAAGKRIRSHLAPDRIARLREDFYRRSLAQFEGARARVQRLGRLPGDCSAAFLMALSQMTGFLATERAGAEVTPGGRLLGIMDELQSKSGQSARVILYGAGKHTARLLCERHIWESRGHQIVGIIDDHPRFAEAKSFHNLPVQSLSEAKKRAQRGERLCPLVLSTDTYEDQFWAQSAPLREAGVPVFRLYSREVA